LTECETASEKDAPAERIVERDIYEWAPGGQFVMPNGESTEHGQQDALGSYSR
jgi:hypothetical protein